MLNFEDSFQKGEKFEQYVSKVIFPESEYQCLHQTPDHSQNSVRPIESAKKPDFQFKCRKTGKIFYVEAKYRSHFNDEEKIRVIEFDQFNRFLSINSDECPVFLIIGYEGRPDNPQEISLIPIRELKYQELYWSVLNNYKIDKSSPISPETLARFFKPNEIRESQTPPSSLKQMKGLNTKTLLIGVVVLIVFVTISLFFFIPKTNHESPGTLKAEENVISELKTNIKKYYESIDNNNVEVLDYFLAKKLDRWYGQRNVPIESVKKESARYYSKYPIHKTDVLWNTFQHSLLPNGDHNISYELQYEIQGEGIRNVKKFHLKIYSIWSKDLKIKSLYESKM
jgi:hypothetical protein